MKKLYILLFALLVSATSQAYDAYINGIYYNISDYEGYDYPHASVTYKNTLYNSYSGNIVIPATVLYNEKTYNVTSIDSYAFKDCSNLTSVTIPESVTSIVYGAFEDCSNLVSIIIPEGATSIEACAFNGCSNLLSITIPESIKQIGLDAFAGTAWYDNQPDGVIYAGKFAYKYKGEMPIDTQIIIKDGTTGIVDGAFEDCRSLNSITIPNSVTIIGYRAFQNCSGLTFITIPNGVTYINSSVFAGCTSLTSITLPNSVVGIGRSAFSGCTSLSSILIPESVISIYEEAFYGCSSLTSAVIPDQVEVINRRTFSGCSSLASITIGQSVSSIREDAFKDCSSLSTVTINRDDIVSVSGSNTRLSPIGSIFGKQVKGYVIGDSVKTIGNWAFNYCDSLTSVIIGSSVTNIGEGAFSECHKLTSINIPNNVTFINNSIFQNCLRLTSITIPENVISIGNDAFRNCGGLTSINIPDGITSIGTGAFSGCFFTKKSFVNLSSLTNSNNWGAKLCDEETDEGLVIDGNATIICRWWATSVIIPDYVTRIGDETFLGCGNLTSVIIPSSVTEIGSTAFGGCISLTSINIPESVTQIFYRTFYGCSNLTSITIPESVTSIGYGAFDGCISLNKIKILGSISEINNYAFHGCCSLSSINIPEGVTSIGGYAFNGCANLASITIPQNVSNIGGQAFNGCKLRNLLIKCTTPPTATTSSFSEQTFYHTTLYVPSDCWDAYAYDDNWYKFSNIREIATLENQVSDQFVYTLMDASTFEYSVYDPVNDCIGTIRSVAGINEDNPNHNWQVMRDGQKQYLYNIGAKKYVIKGKMGLELSDIPTPIEIKDGENGIVLGTQSSRQWALVVNESMNNDKAIITDITPLLPKQDRNSRYYDFSGRKLFAPQKGVNIVNGWKVMIR